LVNMKRVTLVLSLLLLSGHLGAQEVDLMNIMNLDPSIVVDLKYATDDNFMGEVLYEDDRCFLRPRTALKLALVNQELKRKGLGIKVYDCYRPLAVQKRMFERFPQPGFVADPKRGSNHNRGAAVDVGLVNSRRETVPMPSDYDEFSERSHIEYDGATPESIQYRTILQTAMIHAGFEPLKTEWWHFNDPDYKGSEVFDILIKELL